ncbi:NAD(P)H-hydrate dehydratase [Helicobacter cholecystus]|uniref:NAD(P)H-hydrate dehydratase n=1 Tax=Helicobacter cholecystus TaxID=45498 RepID=UPI002738D280|nr:NAD(P)H-hydrate dehydratase [Helicobacter cholecystus]
MKNIFKDTRVLDKRVIERYFLSEEILCENASNALKALIDKVTHQQSLIYIVCGGGGNGADGLALARKLQGEYRVKVFMAKDAKSPLCQKEFLRSKSLGVDFVKKIYPCDVVVDCLFGSGFCGEIDLEFKELLNVMNKMARVRIACDIPSGVGAFFKGSAFKADYTVSMGALKLDLFAEWAKDYVGEILVAPLGISSQNYEVRSNIKLLEQQDLQLPHRILEDTHKGSYGHLAVVVQNKEGSQNGAGVLCAMGAMAFGVGRCTLSGEMAYPPYEMMHSKEIPQEANAIAMGMGMVNVEEKDFDLIAQRSCVLDAGVFSSPKLKNFLYKAKNVVLTPHIKEFASLLKICEIADLSVEEVKIKRDSLLLEFCSMYPEVVVVLKGANTLIAQDAKLYICNLGKNNLAKGGSGDVLAGMIGALLAQGVQSRDAAIYAVLAHSLASRKIASSYGMTPKDLIEAVKRL